MYADFPYNVNKSGGWFTEVPADSCASHGTVKPGGGPKNGSAHSGDWSTADSTTAWMRQVVKDEPTRPFFVFQGMVIVHPPYATNDYWNNKIDRSKVEVPAWQPLMDMHPCDFQASMLKGCTPSDDDAQDFYSVDRRREIRAKYYAMIAEFDAMVGQYMDTVKEMGVWNNTVFIVTSDHGDMQMEKQQFYKMVPYDASASVPMVVLDGRNPIPGGRVITSTTQLIDIFPSIMELAKVPASEIPSILDGHSLLPLLTPTVQSSSRPAFIVSQFHGDDIGMSWFLVVQTTNESTFKLIVWGSNQQVPALLFDLVADPSEELNLIRTPEGLAQHQQLVSTLLVSLRSVVDYASVAQDVAQYNVDSLAAWVNRTPGWEDEIHKSSLRWSEPWDQDPKGSLAAVKELLAAPATIKGCRHNLTWTNN
eukprot:TRINITY_DN3180_c0_g1_i4.p1 TRINITY_DN3180_c0_g1~~TRINITY_DN3180_c0_g1_i4.p1  ORF type:complete len:421 (+),score=103.57 TRINITY_DN3180_c0_g1_i4:336-1598(+)